MRRNTKYEKSISGCCPHSHPLFLQELLEKYQESKKELDELVASMEGL